MKKIVRWFIKQLVRVGTTRFISPTYGDLAYINDKGPCARCVGRLISGKTMWDDSNTVPNGHQVVVMTNLEYLEWKYDQSNANKS